MKIAVLPIYFNDASRVTSHTRAQITAHFDAAKAYYEAQSGGREHLDHRVFDWFMLPLTGAQGVALAFEAGDTVVPLFEAGNKVDLSGYQHFVLLIDKFDARSGAWRPGDPTFRYLHLSAIDLTPALVAHELGHLAGAGHGFLRTPFRDIEYGDTFCIMGGESEKFTFDDPVGPSGPAMTTSMLHACGWLDFNRAGVSVDAGLSSRSEALVDLAPLSGAPAAPLGHPIVAWSDGLTPDHRLLLEFRARSGWDRGLPAAGSGPGLIVAHLTGGNGSAKSSVLIGSVGANAGASLELPDASVTLNVISADANHAALKVTRRIRHLFSGDGGVIYAVSDTGDLFWYRHDGRGDGSFRWADNNPRRVGTSWNFRQIFYGGDGVIYAVNSANDLLWFRHDGHADGSFRWADNNARTVGTGWNFKRLFSGGGGVIYALNDANDLLWFRHDGRGDGSFRWADNNPRTVGTGWAAKQIFPSSDSDGVIYVINDENDLLWYRHDGRNDGSFRWADNNSRKVGTGWNFKHAFSGGGGVIYAVSDANDVLWYRHDGRGDGSFRWADNNSRKVGVGWNLKHHADIGATPIYAIDAEQQLIWYLHDGRKDGGFRWRFDKPRVVGVGWDVVHIFSGGDSVIYTIDASGVLRWYRHDGRVSGSFNWTSAPTRSDGSTEICGTGWNMKHVFSGGEGVIYAIDAANDLLWYRHDGRADGSFKWVDNKGRKVGVGWDFNQIFGA